MIEIGKDEQKLRHGNTIRTDEEFQLLTFNAPMKKRNLKKVVKHRQVGSLQWRTQEFCWRGGSANSAEDRGQRERGSAGGSTLVRCSGGSCNLVQEISFHIVKVS